MKEIKLILVDEHDEPLGEMEKLEAHRQGLLHRAFSVFIFNPAGMMLLQQRGLNKYHSPGLWSNACCSHPEPGQDTRIAAEKRLMDEMGFTVPLAEKFSFIYRAELPNGLVEHEFDHVFTGIHDGEIRPDPFEVRDYCYKSMDDIRMQLAADPSRFTVWFKLAFERLAKS